MDIKIKVTNFNYLEVVGYVGIYEVIKINNYISKSPSIACSTCLPSDYITAKLYSDCMQRAFEEWEKLCK